MPGLSFAIIQVIKLQQMKLAGTTTSGPAHKLPHTCLSLVHIISGYAVIGAVVYVCILWVSNLVSNTCQRKLSSKK